jgi:hypothetical protein
MPPQQYPPAAAPPQGGYPQAQYPQAQYPPGQYAAPGGQTAPKSKKGLIIAIVLIGLLLLGACSVVAGVFFYRSRTNVPTTSSPASTDTSTDATDTSASSGVFQKPESAVEAFYSAVAAGDLKKAASLFPTQPAFMARYDEMNGAAPSFRIVDTKTSGDKTTVTVQEEDPAPAQAKITVEFTLAKAGTGWRLVSIAETVAEVAPTTKPEATAPKKATGPALTDASATDVVGRMLEARKNDDVDTAASLFSPAGLQSMPGVEGDKQYLRTATALVSFEVTSVEKAPKGLYVWVKEVWISGDEKSRYNVDVVGGKLLIVNGYFAPQ